MNNIKKWPGNVFFGFGIANIIYALVGILLLFSGLYISYSNIGSEQYLNIMVTINIVFLVCLFLTGIYLIKKVIKVILYCNILYVLELIYFFSILFIFPRIINIGIFYIAALKFGNTGIICQIITGYPIIALILLNLAKVKFRTTIPSDNKESIICPDCSENLRFVEQNDKYWCDTCLKYMTPDIGKSETLNKQTASNENIKRFNCNNSGNEKDFVSDNHYKKCPFCGKEIKVKAIFCRYCKEELTPKKPFYINKKTISLFIIFMLFIILSFFVLQFDLINKVKSKFSVNFSENISLSYIPEQDIFNKAYYSNILNNHKDNFLNHLYIRAEKYIEMNYLLTPEDSSAFKIFTIILEIKPDDIKLQYLLYNIAKRYNEINLFGKGIIVIDSGKPLIKAKLGLSDNQSLEYQEELRYMRNILILNLYRYSIFDFEKIGGLYLGMHIDEVKDILGYPDETTESYVYTYGDPADDSPSGGYYSYHWEYNSGISIYFSYNTVDAISIKATSDIRTKCGIGIGDDKERVINAYIKYIFHSRVSFSNQGIREFNTETELRNLLMKEDCIHLVLLHVPDIFGGGIYIYFDENNKVSHISLSNPECDC